jgi:hypothetical protein
MWLCLKRLSACWIGSPPGGRRSCLISDTVIYYVFSRGRINLAEKLKAGALANAKRDMAIAQE